MNGLDERAAPADPELLLTIRFVDGSEVEQPYPIEDAEALQDLMDWFRHPGRARVFSLHAIDAKQIQMLHHPHIICIEVLGYIEPEGRSARWYERPLHKYKAWRVARALSRGGGRKHGNRQ